MRMTRRRLLTLGTVGAVSAAFGTLPSRAQQAGRLHEIEIRNFTFRPARLEVRPGDTVRWTNRDRATHDATAIDGSWRTVTLRRGDSAEVVIRAGMGSEYICSIHPQMRASLNIVGA